MIAGCAGQPVTKAPEPTSQTSAATSTAMIAKAAVPHAATLRVAITLDDLGGTEASVEPALSRRISSQLRQAGAPVAVFVNCKFITSSALTLWQQAGATFGNHSATHLSVDTAGPDDTWWHDVESCDRQMRGFLGRPVHYFRFPYLRYGQTAETRETAARKLSSLGYEIAHVTAATSEWLLADYYASAVDKHDRALSVELAEFYVEHMLESLQAARQLALDKTGREIAQVTLAHVNRLAGDHLSDALAAFKARGWQFVSLQEALADPVYAQRDAYAGPCGCSWLARIAPAVKPGDVYVFGDYEDQIRARFGARIAAIQRQK